MAEKVLLINSNTEINPNPVLPGGMAYVASGLFEKGFEVSCADLCFKKNWRQYLKTEIEKISPDFIGISIRNIDNHDESLPKFYPESVKHIIEYCRVLSKARIFCGGAALAVMPENIFRYLGADAGIFGDGEETAPALLKSWSSDSDCSKIPGLVYEKDGQISVNPAKGIGDLDSINYEGLSRWIDLKPYFDREASYPVQGKRGCPFDCIYCTYAKGEGKHYRFRSAERIAQEIFLAHEKYRPKMIEFVDSIFNHPPGFAEDICRELIKINSRARLHTIELNPGFLTPELISLMERAGFVSCGLTCESASETVLKNLRKSYGVKEVVAAAKNLRNSRMKKLWVFLLGGPGEDADTVRETLSFVRKELGRGDVVFFNIGIRIYPGTEIEAIARKEGIINASTDLLFPVFYISPKITRKAIEEMIRQEKNNNIVTIKDSRLPYLSTLLRLAGLLRLKAPYWSYTPVFNRIRSLLWLK